MGNGGSSFEPKVVFEVGIAMDPCHGVSFEDASLPAHSGLCARVMAIEQGSSLAGSLVIGDYVTHAGEHQIESAAGLGRLLAGEITEHSES